MFHTFIRRAIGYKKLQRGKGTEDSVKAVRMKEASICAVADGHGDPTCVYANVGADLATRVACEVLRVIYQGCPDDETRREYCAGNREAIIQQIIRSWNQAVVEDYFTREGGKKHPHGKEKMLSYVRDVFDERPPKGCTLDEARAYFAAQGELEDALKKIARLYGTTLNAVLQTQTFIFCLGIGDGDVISVQDDDAEWLLPPAEQFSTKTQSLCWRPRKALEAFRSVVIRKSDKKRPALFDTGIKPDYLLIATDGLRNSFVSDGLFLEKLVEINKEKANGYKQFQRNSQAWIEGLTKDSLYQDDISLGFIFE